MTKFEFFHSQSEEYFVGERREEGFTINSNFMINDFEINCREGISFLQPGNSCKDEG